MSNLEDLFNRDAVTGEELVTVVEALLQVRAPISVDDFEAVGLLVSLSSRQLQKLLDHPHMSAYPKIYASILDRMAGLGLDPDSEEQ